jgi:hypothetical protein
VGKSLLLPAGLRSIIAGVPDLSFSRWLTIGCAVLALAAAVLAIYASQIEIRDSLDTMAEDEKRIAWWNTLAGSLNALSCALLLIGLAIESSLDRS